MPDKEGPLTPDKMTIEQLEAHLYERYYEENPNGDARYDLWPDVIKAKKDSSPHEAMLNLLDSYGLN